jgi:AraC-like DNA-binding protein
MLQLMAEFLFQPAQEELFCARQKRVARERVESAKALLRERFTEPPSIEELGRHAGVSSFYLSRTFSQEVGMTIPQYVRQLRMERAAELLGKALTM